MVFHLSLSDSKFFEISPNILSILADLNNAVVWMVPPHPLISNSSSPYTNPSGSVSSAPITFGTALTSTFHSFVSSLAWSWYLPPFSLFFSFTLWSAGTAKSTIWQLLFFMLTIAMSGHLAKIRWSVILLFIPWVFFTSALADGFHWIFEWQQVSSRLQDSS